MYGNRAPKVSAGPSHLDRQRGFQEKGKYGQACNKKREGSCVCVTGVSLKIFGELMAESSLWHLQLAGPVGATRCCYHGEGSRLSSTGEYTLLFLSKGWLSCSTNSKQRPSRLWEFYTTMHFVTSLTPTDETNNRWIPFSGIQTWNTSVSLLARRSSAAFYSAWLSCFSFVTHCTWETCRAVPIWTC